MRVWENHFVQAARHTSAIVQFVAVEMTPNAFRNNVRFVTPLLCIIIKEAMPQNEPQSIRTTEPASATEVLLMNPSFFLLLGNTPKAATTKVKSLV
jgi:hypothetical protein